MFLLPPSTFEVFIEVNISNLCFLFLVTEMEYKKQSLLKNQFNVQSMFCVSFIYTIMFIYYVTKVPKYCKTDFKKITAKIETMKT